MTLCPVVKSAVVVGFRTIVKVVPETVALLPLTLPPNWNIVLGAEVRLIFIQIFPVAGSPCGVRVFMVAVLVPVTLADVIVRTPYSTRPEMFDIVPAVNVENVVIVNDVVVGVLATIYSPLIPALFCIVISPIIAKPGA